MDAAKFRMEEVWTKARRSRPSTRAGRVGTVGDHFLANIFEINAVGENETFAHLNRICLPRQMTSGMIHSYGK